jgi:hypothetical protein
MASSVHRPGIYGAARSLALGSVAALALFSLAAPEATGRAVVRSVALCGVERWNVKTLQDRPWLRPARVTTVATLDRLPAPTNLPPTRLPLEHRIYAVTAAVIGVRPEDDGDYHLLLRDGWHRMIAETPSFSCTSRATPRLRREMAQARSAVRVCHRARITGVLFFDFDHGQTGVAPNAVELHPVLGFRCLRP